MSIRFWNWAWSQEQLTTVETLLLLSLSDMADDTGQSFPGIKTLAKRCRTSERTIQRCIAALKGKGLVQVRPRIVGGQQTSNFYILIADLSAPQAKKGQGDKLSPGVVDVIPVATSDAATGDSHVTQIFKNTHHDNHDSCGELEFPACIDQAQQHACLAKLRGMATADAQLVLDELAARRELSVINDPIAYLSTLLLAWKQSTFDPHLALDYRAKKKLAAERLVASEKERTERRMQRSRVDFEENAKRLKEILSEL
jgi:hypothetical protein